MELDGLRAFAVCMVVVFHMMLFGKSLPAGPTWMTNVVGALGPKAVHVFFVISGFIITTLLVREKATTGQVSLPAFYVRRALRIVPPFGAYLAILLLLRLMGVVNVSLSDVGWSALFLGNTGLLSPENWLVGHTWSLSVEEQYYLLFPPLFCLVLDFRVRRACVGLCVVYILCAASLKLGKELANYFGQPWGGVALLYQFRYIIIGVVLALCGQPMVSRLKGRTRFVPVMLLGFSIAPVFVSMSGKVSFLFELIEPVACGLLVMWFVQNPEKCGVLRWRAVQWVGACSYSIYLWQQLFTGPVAAYNGWSWNQSPWSLCAIVLAAALSYYGIERPSIRFGKLLSARIMKSRNESALYHDAATDLSRQISVKRTSEPSYRSF